MINKLDEASFNVIGCRLLITMPIASLANPIDVTKVAGLAIHLSDLIYVATAIVLLGKIVVTQKMKTATAQYLVALGSLLFITCAGYLLVGKYQANWPEFARFIEALSWGVFGLEFVGSPEAVGWLVNSVILSGIILSASSVYLFLTVPGLQQIAGFFSAAGGKGLPGQASYNEIGALYSMILITSLILLLYPVERHRGKRAVKYYRLVGFFMNLIGLILVQSRSAELSLVVAATIVVLVPEVKAFAKGHLRKRFALMVVILLGAVTMLVSVAGHLAVNRISESFIYGSNAQQNITDRFKLWSEGLALWRANPRVFLVGWGGRTFSSMLSSATTDNFYLDHALSNGFVGVLSILFIMLTPGIRIMRRRRHGTFKRLILGTLTIAAVISLTGNVLVDPFLGGVTFLLLYGYTSAHGREERRGSN